MKILDIDEDISATRCCSAYLPARARPRPAQAVARDRP
jgi:hypothetical protein